MKKKKYLHTNFIKFIIEKYDREIQELPEEETNISNNELSDEFDRIINGDEVQDELDDDDDDNDDNDENIEDLIKEYKLLEKKYKLKSNGYIPNRRK